MLRRLCIAAAGILPALFITSANANAVPAPTIMTPHIDVGGVNDWCGTQIALCLRDPSDGGAGTTVVASGQSASGSEDWRIILDTGRCTNAVVTSTCPGGWVSSHFAGSPIVVIKNVGQGTLCIRTAADTQYVAKMGTCDSGNDISSAFVLHSIATGEFGFDSIDASNALNQQEWLSMGTSNDSTVFDRPGGITIVSEWTDSPG